MPLPPLTEWSTKLVAGLALDAEKELDGDQAETHAEIRTEALDELVRRGAIESYSLVPGDHVQPA